MLKTIIERLLQGIVVIFFLLTLTFILIRMIPGNPLTDEKAMSPQVLKENMKIYKLDKSYPVQYVYYWKSLFQGEMGISIKKKQPVLKIIKQSFPVSVIIGICGMLIAIGIGIPAGIIAALKHNSLIDNSAMLFALVGISIPSFVIGPLLAKSVATNVPFLKVAGWGDPFDWILPSVTLGLGTAAYLARITRAGMLDILSQDFIRTAQAKGVSQKNIIIKHALKGGLVPAITFVGPAFAMLITGSFVVETIFQVPGMGQHFVNSVNDRDYFLIQGMVLLFGVLIVTVNLAADVLLTYLNPRLRT
ncbi:MAG: ABC transporter permease [Rubritalea sp.]|jgi:oligopeptide transport system permease protein